MNIAMYAGDSLGPGQIGTNMAATKSAGWSTVNLCFIHIGNTAPDGSILFFNNTPIIQDQRVLPPFDTWNASLTELKQGSNITKLYMSIGGDGRSVVDFATIQKIYKANGNSFADTPLLKNLECLRNSFPAIDGIDMDCEETYDQASFVAFCQLMHDIGFNEISFAPYEKADFWIGSLKQIQNSTWGYGLVKWFNLQSYGPFPVNPPIPAPGPWAEAITDQIQGFDTDGFILAGAWARYKTGPDSWDKMCPGAIEDQFKNFKRSAPKSMGGGFIWNMDYMLETTTDPSGCGEAKTMTDYYTAIFEAMEEG